jgi:small subunit ribosomal protein S6
MRDYELMVVLSPELDEEGVTANTERIGALVQARGGEVANVDVWGRRRLAYSIDRHRDGQYVVLRLKLVPASTDQLERGLRLNESVIRHLLVRANAA